jgi:hypothetical protein
MPAVQLVLLCYKYSCWLRLAAVQLVRNYKHSWLLAPVRPQYRTSTVQYIARTIPVQPKTAPVPTQYSPTVLAAQPELVDATGTA